MADIWHEQVNIRFGSVDRSDRLTLWSIINFFQEAAISHAEELGVGRDALEREGQAWILSRLSLVVDRRPRNGETVTVSTWPRRWEKLFALRDYDIRDADNKAVVRGRGAWLVLDMAKRKPMRIQPIADSLPANDGIDAFPEMPAALGSREKSAKKTERTALYSDIDYNGHANNARYIQWIQDATDADILTKADFFRLDINYLSQVMPGDAVEIWMAPLDEGFAYEGRRPAGTAGIVFRAELKINIK